MAPCWEQLIVLPRLSPACGVVVGTDHRIAIKSAKVAKSAKFGLLTTACMHFGC